MVSEKTVKTQLARPGGILLDQANTSNFLVRKKEPFAGGAGTYEGQEARVNP
jgi:hypothetical protein